MRPATGGPVIGPKLYRFLIPLFGLIALMGANSVYMVSVTALGEDYQTAFYLYMVLLHLGLGLLLIPALALFVAGHMWRAWRHPNRRAVRAGLFLLACCILIAVSGFLLVRFEGFLEIRDPRVRSVAYWLHVLTPLAAVGAYLVHRKAGPPIQWRWVAGWCVGVAFFVVVMASLHHQPLNWGRVGPREGARYFFPSAMRTNTGKFIPAKILMLDEYCAECHPDAYEQHLLSAHRNASFSNPAYLFSVRETRRVAKERDGSVRAARWCAGCHDLVPFLSGKFESPEFDDPNYDPSKDPLGSAGITCVSCHAVTAVNARTGNSALTISEPPLYPFTFAKNPILKWLNRQLIKAKPALHKRTFLKPFHRPRQPDDPPQAVRQAEFCGACHRVHLPFAVTHYKDWLRGQDHYGAFLASGVSGHGVKSFYYPPKAAMGCADCHMPLTASNDFGAQDYDGTGQLKIHNHLFVGANTGLARMVGNEPAIKAHQEFLKGKLRIDIFGLREGGTIEGNLLAPIRPELPTLEPGKAYLVEVVIRTLKMGHLFTQGTIDSNEVWVDITARLNGTVIGRSGAIDSEGYVDPWSHFVNALVLDRHGNRIDRRNAQDIFVKLYDHQIPPGAAQVVHYLLQVPPDASGAMELTVKLNYRKFDRIYLDYIYGKGKGPELPVTVLCEDQVILPVGKPSELVPKQEAPAPQWERWNDYGIGLLLEGQGSGRQGELRQALAAFQKVAELGSPHGYVNQARVYVKEGNLPAAIEALHRAAESKTPYPYPWVVTWLTGVVNKQNGFLEEAIANFKKLLSEEMAREVRKYGFEFRKNAEVWTELGATQFELAKLYRKRGRKDEQRALLHEAIDSLYEALFYEPEFLSAHFHLGLIYQQLAGELAARELRGEPKDPSPYWRPSDEMRRQVEELARTKDADEIVALSTALARQVVAYAHPAARREPFQGKPDLLQELLYKVKPLYERRKAHDDEATRALAWLLATIHQELHGLYLPDPEARNRAIAIHRAKNPAADHAAEGVVIYSLHRENAPGLAEQEQQPRGAGTGARP